MGLPIHLIIMYENFRKTDSVKGTISYYTQSSEKDDFQTRQSHTLIIIMLLHTSLIFLTLVQALIKKKLKLKKPQAAASLTLANLLYQNHIPERELEFKP